MRRLKYIFKTILFYIIVIAFYSISIWQYKNPTKAIRLWSRPAYTDQPKVDEAFVKRSLIIRGIFFTVGFIVIIISTKIIKIFDCSITSMEKIEESCLRVKYMSERTEINFKNKEVRIWFFVAVPYFIISSLVLFIGSSTYSYVPPLLLIIAWITSYTWRSLYRRKLKRKV